VLALLTSLALLVSATTLAPPSNAYWGGQDGRVGTVVLVPWFEVDLGEPGDGGNNGDRTTLITLFNGYPTAALVNLTLWTDRGVPVHEVDLYLTGLDVEVIDLRMLLAYGLMPRTASAGQDPGNLISPQGSISQDINFSSCSALLPPAIMDEQTRLNLVAALRGQPVAAVGDRCLATPWSEDTAASPRVRGYATIRSTLFCDPQTYGTPGYFDGTRRGNYLGGTWEVLDRSTGQSFGDPLLTLESYYTDPVAAQVGLTTLPPDGTPTFFGRTLDWNGTDSLEPLGAAFATTFGTAGPASDHHLIAWREPPLDAGPFDCAAAASTMPLTSLELVDQDGTPVTRTTTNPFPQSTQKVSLGDLGAASLPTSGMVFADLRDPTATDGPPGDPTFRNAWLITVFESPTASWARSAAALPTTSGAP
jgi:hypothetical protein